MQMDFFRVNYKGHTYENEQHINELFENTISIPSFGNYIGDVFKNMELPCVNENTLFRMCCKITSVDQLNELPECIKEKVIEQKRKDSISWTNNIGYRPIHDINIEIGGLIIDKDYGAWGNILTELHQAPN